MTSASGVNQFLGRAATFRSWAKSEISLSLVVTPAPSSLYRLVWTLANSKCGAATRSSLFTKLPRRGLLGNWVSGVWSSRKLNLYHYSFSKPLYIGVFLYAADRPVHDELPPYGVLGNC